MTSKLKLILFLLAISAVTFYLSPILDQRLAILPYDFTIARFYGEITLWCKVVYYSVNVTTFLLIITPIIIILLSRKGKINLAKPLVKRMVLITYLSLALGPGLICNSLLKDNWGRARPYQVIRDHHPFSYPWQPHFDRPADNSFPSGHVTIGAFVGVPFIAARRKKLGVALCIAGFTLVGIVRYLQGGHYFSDIVMAATIVWLVNILVTEIVDKYFMTKRN